MRSPRIKQNQRGFGVYGARTQHNVGSFIGLFCRHVVDTSNLRGLDCCGGRVVVGAVAVVVVAAIIVVERAVGYVVTSLATLEAGVLPFVVIHQRTLVVDLVPGVSIPSWLVPSVCWNKGLVARLPGAWPRRWSLLVILAWLKFPLVVVIDRAVLFFCDKRGVYQGLEVWELQHIELCLEGLVHPMKETVLLFLIRVGISWSIAGKVVELSQVLADTKVALFECQKFLLLDLYGARGNV